MELRTLTQIVIGMALLGLPAYTLLVWWLGGRNVTISVVMSDLGRDYPWVPAVAAGIMVFLFWHWFLERR